MPNLRQALKQTSGVDVGGKEFTLTETDIQSDIDNPELAQMEADLFKARYGGSAIQDPSPSAMPAAGSPGSSPYTDEMAPPGAYEGPLKSAVDFSRRGDFEKSVFKQLTTETIPDGNPFNFNPTASMNAISKKDLPELFSTVFQNQVTWQDRHLLDDDQKKYWMGEVKAYRAHLKGALDAEREQAINGYNQMMNSFDNAAKEQEVVRKRQRQRGQDIMTAKTKGRERQSKRQQTHQANLKRRAELLTKMRELTETVMEASTTTNLSEAESKAFTRELQGYRDELKVINAEIGSRQVLKPKSGITKVEAGGKATEPELEQGASKKTVVRKKVPKQGARTIVKRGTYKGRKVVKYSDGSMAYADETD